MIHPDEAASASLTGSAAPQAQALPAQQTSLLQTDSSILHPSPLTAIPLTPLTDGINGRKILNANSAFSAFKTQS